MIRRYAENINIEVGTGSVEGKIKEMSEEEVDIEKLSLEEKLDHKLWKARLRGYQDLQKQLEGDIIDPSLEEKLWRNADEFGRYIQDSNVVALESAVVALNVFLDRKISKILAENDNSRSFAKVQIDTWVPVLIIKPLSSTRAVTKKNAAECILKLASLMESLDIIIILILEKLPGVIRQPKPTAAIINILDQLLKGFRANLLGSPDLLKQLLEPLGKLCSHADRNVRSETMNLIVTIFFAVDGFQNRPLLDELLLGSLKPIQIKDMDKLIEKQKDQTTTQGLYVWEQIENKKTENFAVDHDGDTIMMENSTSGKGIESNAQLEGKSNALDSLIPGETILDKLPEDFHVRINSQKWKDRVEAMEEYYGQVLSKLKKIDSDSNENYSDLFSNFGQIIAKDVNVQAVTLAAESVDKILKALPKKKLNKHLILLVYNPLLDRTKEKKPTVIEAIRVTLKTIMMNNNPLVSHNEDLLVSLLQYMEHRIPQIKMECTSLFNYVLTLDTPGLNLKSSYLASNINDIIPIVLKVVNDTNPTIRNVGFECFANLVALIGKRPFVDSLDKLDSQKRKKIEDMIAVKSRPGSADVRSDHDRSSTLLPTKRPPTSPLKKPSTSNSPKSRVLLTSRALTKPNFGSGSTASQNNNTTLTSSNTPNKRINKNMDMDNNAHGSNLPIANGSSIHEKERWDKDRSELLQKIRLLENSNSDLTTKNNELTEKLEAYNKEKEQFDLILTTRDRENEKLVEKINLLERKIKELHEKLETPATSGRSFSFNTEFAMPESRRFTESSDEELPKRVNSLRINSRSSTLNSADQQPLFSKHQSGKDDEESWKRAAEVTRKLKERIETMKARNRELGN